MSTAKQEVEPPTEAKNEVKSKSERPKKEIKAPRDEPKSTEEAKKKTSKAAAEAKPKDDSKNKIDTKASAEAASKEAEKKKVDTKKAAGAEKGGPSGEAKAVETNAAETKTEAEAAEARNQAEALALVDELHAMAKDMQDRGYTDSGGPRAAGGGGPPPAGEAPAAAPTAAAAAGAATGGSSFGLAVSKTAASKDFFDFAAVFEPFCDEKKGAKAREEGFKTADPNGNGLCSLAELETFVLKSLVARYPRVGKGRDMREPGKGLFEAFRPCYIRAFADAKDYKADSGAVLEGTKTATGDDYVTKEELRLFCVYLIIYAAMFDLFAKIDGGGAGRDAKDDKRIVRDEWLAGYKGAEGYGFAALDGLASKKDAGALFLAMDANGGGVVLLDEWCACLKAAEVAAGTPVGRLLAMDEAAAAGGGGNDSAGRAEEPGKAAPGDEGGGEAGAAGGAGPTGADLVGELEGIAAAMEGAGPPPAAAEPPAPAALAAPANSKPAKRTSVVSSDAAFETEVLHSPPPQRYRTASSRTRRDSTPPHASLFFFTNRSWNRC